MTKEEVLGWLVYFAGDEWQPPEGRSGLVYGVQALRRAIEVVKDHYDDPEYEELK